MNKKRAGMLVGIVAIAISVIGAPAFMVYAKTFSKNNLTIISTTTTSKKSEEIPNGEIAINSPKFDALFSQEVSALVNQIRTEKGLKSLNITEPVNDEAAIFKVKDMDITGLTQKCSNGKTLAQIYSSNQKNFTGWDLQDALVELPVKSQYAPMSEIKTLAQQTVNKLLENGIILSTDHTYQGAALTYYNGTVRVAYVITNYSMPK